jgi:hypothetical protein
LNKPGLLVFKSSKTFGVGKVRFFFRASVSIGKRESFFSTALCAAGVLLLLNCADRLTSSEPVFCDVVFIVFFLWTARPSSVGRLVREKAEPPALLRGSGLQKAPRNGGLVF